MKEYLVTGGLGFIGSHLVENLLQKENTRVWIIDDGSRPAWNPRKGRIDYDVHVRDLLVQIMGGYEVDSDTRDPRLVCISGDCAHHNILTRIRAGHFRSVFHLAASTSVVKSIENPLDYLDKNVAKTLSIAQACAEGKTRLIFSSSAAVYGDNDTSTPICETASKNPQNPYGLSKLTCENWFRAYKDLYGLDYVNLRYFNVYGERQQGGSPYAGVIGNWIHALHFKKPITVYGDGTQTRDFIHVSDVARANIKAIDVPTTGFNTYNICYGSSVSLNEVIGFMEMNTSEKFKVITESAREGEIQNSVGSNARALVGLEWTPSMSVPVGIRGTLHWRGVR